MRFGNPGQPSAISPDGLIKNGWIDKGYQSLTFTGGIQSLTWDVNIPEEDLIDIAVVDFKIRFKVEVDASDVSLGYTKVLNFNSSPQQTKDFYIIQGATVSTGEVYSREFYIMSWKEFTDTISSGTYDRFNLSNISSGLSTGQFSAFMGGRLLFLRK